MCRLIAMKASVIFLRFVAKKSSVAFLWRFPRGWNHAFVIHDIFKGYESSVVERSDFTIVYQFTPGREVPLLLMNHEVWGNYVVIASTSGRRFELRPLVHHLLSVFDSQSFSYLISVIVVSSLIRWCFYHRSSLSSTVIYVLPSWHTWWWTFNEESVSQPINYLSTTLRSSIFKLSG